MSEITRSSHNVRLSNLNWGYQIMHDTQVLAAIHDTQGGPRRTEQCSEEARKKYEILCPIYERLYREIPNPSYQQLNLLASIIRGDVTDEYHRYGKPNGSTARSLIRRGIIRKVDPHSPSLVYRDYVVLDGNLSPVKIYEE